MLAPPEDVWRCRYRVGYGKGEELDTYRKYRDGRERWKNILFGYPDASFCLGPILTNSVSLLRTCISSSEGQQLLMGLVGE